jgi:2-polyprenyl-6-methoxyphenol hydroxylase-like FAD-dependent oxidoreductase
VKLIHHQYIEEIGGSAMRVAIIGMGPAGLLAGAALARRGHEVIGVERDPGPAGPDRWARLGVMQFHLAHGFRDQVSQVLREELPDALGRWLALGAEPVGLSLPGGGEIPLGLRSRRETFERALRAAALAQPGLTLRQGHVETVLSQRGRARGLRIDGAELAADLVLDASGRAGRPARSLRAPASSGGPCGVAYVDRMYQLRPGAEPGPLLNPIVWQAEFDRYQVIVFPHERGIFSVVLVRPADDPALARLRHEPAFTAAAHAIPGLADWVDPDRAQPVTPVFAGAGLVNAYRGQTGPDGRLALPGLIFAGDAVATTNPTFGRGVTTTFLQVRQLLRLTDQHGADLTALGESFDAWCADQIKPWVDDHVHMDECTQSRWAGQDIDLSRPLPSDRILAAAEQDPAIRGASVGYLSMNALPASLRAAEDRARAVYASGWRPAPAPGPDGDELTEIVEKALLAPAR